jgi:hypothetical protein
MTTGGTSKLTICWSTYTRIAGWARAAPGVIKAITNPTTAIPAIIRLIAVSCLPCANIHVAVSQPRPT